MNNDSEISDQNLSPTSIATILDTCTKLLNDLVKHKISDSQTNKVLYTVITLIELVNELTKITKDSDKYILVSSLRAKDKFYRFESDTHSYTVTTRYTNGDIAWERDDKAAYGTLKANEVIYSVIRN